MNQEKKILVVYHILPHYRFGVFNELKKSNKYKYVFAGGLGKDNSIPNLTELDIDPVVKLDNIWLGRFLWQRGLLKQILNGNYDAIIFLGDMSYISTWFAGIVCRVKGIKFLFWTIGWHRIEVGIKKIIRNLFYSLPNRLMLYGQTGLLLGNKNGFNGKKISVIYNSHESNLNKQSGKSEKEIHDFISNLPCDEKPKVGAIVRLNHVKRLDLVLEAIALLNRKGHQLDVIFVGDGPARDSLAEKANQLGVRLFMPGAAYDQREIEAVYKIMTVTVIPVWAGLSAIQSLSHGRPTVTTDDINFQAPESECIRHGVTGMYYHEGSIESLAQCIWDCHQMATNKSQNFKEAADFELNQRWTSAAHARAIESAIDSLLNQ